MMNCPNCGEPNIPAEAARCPQCGEPLPEKTAMQFDIHQQAGSVDGEVVGVRAVQSGEITNVFNLAGLTPEQARALVIEQTAPPRLAPTPLAYSPLGREKELEVVEPALASGGKFYFHGPLGVGKTTLTNHLFHRARGVRDFKDGWLWSDNPRLTAEEALEWVAAQFHDRTVAQAAGREAKVGALRLLLSRRPDLLIAFDELRDPGAARALLQAAGECTLLLNGPAPVSSPQAMARELGPLDPASAVALFLQIAGMQGEGLAEKELGEVEQICRRLRYQPLAIRLAAHRRQAGDSLKTLSRHIRFAPERLLPEYAEESAVFEASWADLEKLPAARAVLVRLAGFPNAEAPLDAVDPGAGEAGLYQARDRLVALGLVDALPDDRLAVLPLLGRLAQLKAGLQEQGAGEAAAERWLLDYAGRNREDFQALQREYDNLVGLLDRYYDGRRWDDLVGLLRHLFTYLRVRGLWEQAFRRLDQVLEAVEQLESRWNRGWAFLHRGILLTLRSELEAASRDFDRAEELFAAEGDPVYRGKTLYRRSALYALRGDYRQAEKLLRDGLELMGREAPYDRAAAYAQLATLLVTQGSLDEAQQHYRLALETGNDETRARVHTSLGDLERRQGAYERAQEHFNQAMVFAGALGDVLQQAAIQQELGYVHYYQGDTARAEAHFQAAQALYAAVKHQAGLARIQHALGNLAYAREDLDRAREHYQAALAINESLGLEAGAAYNRYHLGVIEHRSGRPEQAAQIYTESLERARQMRDASLEMAALSQLGSLHFEQGKRRKASEYLSRAARMAESNRERLAGAVNLYYTGLLQAQEGHLDTALETLAKSHAEAAALNSVEAEKAAQAIEALNQAKSEPGKRLKKKKTTVTVKSRDRRKGGGGSGWRGGTGPDIILPGKADKPRDN